MKIVAKKQPTRESVKPKKSGARSRAISPLSTGMPLLQRQCACGGGCPRCQEELGLQTKLKISEPGDKYEQEADRVAEQIMRMPAPENVGQRVQRSQPLRIQRIYSNYEKETVSSIPEVTTAIASRIQFLQGSGQPLPSSVRNFFEPRFDQDFSEVRVHSDTQSTQALNARAYTVGQNIVFGAGQYMPDTFSGQHLLAHELTHTIQQKGALQIARQANSQPSPPQTFGATCSGGTTDPCQQVRCTGQQPVTVQNDLGRAIRYVNAATTALNATPLADNTVRALDWYFNDHNASTINAVRTRLGCILTCLQDTQNNNRYGCHPNHSSLAYVCVGNIPVCSHRQTNICLTNQHFGTSPRVRAETAIHECAHRVGMSLGSPNSVPDIYEFTGRFLFLDTSEALQNSDSFALFAGAITGGIPLTVLFPVFSGTGSAALSESGALTWQSRFYIGAEFQHPVLSIFNPTLGIGISVIGETSSDEPSSPPEPSPTYLLSLLGGVRIADPRPGAAGGVHLSIFGGPSIAIEEHSETEIGAEVGLAFGYRWRWLDFSANVGFAYDPTREADMNNLFTLGASVSFIP